MSDENGKSEEGRVEVALALSEPAPSSLEWLEPIYREHARTVLRAAYRVTGSVADAEDVVQTVFLRLARREEAPLLGDGAAAYLRRAATNAALDLVQSKRVKTSAPLEDAPLAAEADPAATPERIHLGHELKERLREALSKLNRRNAQMFVMRYFEGLDNRMIADHFKTSPGTVAVTLHRARTRLLDDLRPYMGGMQ